MSYLYGAYLYVRGFKQTGFNDVIKLFTAVMYEFS